MDKTVSILDMFSDYTPPEELQAALSQAAIDGADLDPERRSVHVFAHSESYIPKRFLDRASRELASAYTLSKVELTVTHPASELTKCEPEELMGLFVSLDSMTRGSLAGARWSWEGTNLTIRLSANGKDALEELIPQVRQSLFARFGVEVTIQVEAGTSLEGKALFDALDSMRDRMMEKLPAQAAAEPERPKTQT